MSIFFTDADCELWYEEFDTLNIQLIKMPYTLEDRQYFYDLGRNTDIKAFYDKMRNGAVPKTQALNSYDYIEYFEPFLSKGEDIYYVSFSHNMSGTFNALEMAKKELAEKYPERKITVVDTKSISVGAGIIVYFAAKLHNEGADDDTVTEFIQKLRSRVATYFTVSDLVYLKRGGRLSSFKTALGSMFDLKPIITVTDEGTLENIKKVKGRKLSIKTLVDYISFYGLDESYPIYLLNADSEEDAKFTESLIREKFPEAVIKHQPVGPVIGSHCGPDTIGIIFVKAEKEIK